MVFQNLIMEGVESRKNVRKTVEQTMWKLTNKETLTMLCSVVKHARGGLEHERSVRGNTRRSRMFLSTSWVLTLTLTSLLFLPFTPCSRSAFVPIIPITCFSLVVSRFLLFGSLSAHHSALEKAVWRRQIYSYMYLGMQSSKQGMWNGCHLSMEDKQKEYLFRQK